MKNINGLNLIKVAGAYIAFMIGSGFATGQEIMQFYTSFGKWSILAVLVSMLLFAWSGSAFMANGFDVRDTTPSGGEYQRYCGKYLGKFYELFVTLLLFCVTIVMVSGSGATLNEYYGLPYTVGTALMAILIYLAYIFGLKGLVNVIGCIGPVIIIFTMLVGIVTLIRSGGNLAHIDEAMQNVQMTQSSSNWLLSGILYCCYNVSGSVIFLNALGQSATSHREARLAGIVGAVLFMGGAFVMNLAFLANVGDVGALSIPTLYLANAISPVVGVIFSVVLVLGIFSTAAPMAWTVCDRFVQEGTLKSKIFAAVFMIIAFFGGQLPFGTLVGIIYPYTGYLGILLFICLAVYQIKGRNGLKKTSDSKEAENE